MQSTLSVSSQEQTGSGQMHSRESIQAKKALVQKQHSELSRVDPIVDRKRKVPSSYFIFLFIHFWIWSDTLACETEHGATIDSRFTCKWPCLDGSWFSTKWYQTSSLRHDFLDAVHPLVGSRHHRGGWIGCRCFTFWRWHLIAGFFLPLVRRRNRRGTRTRTRSCDTSPRLADHAIQSMQAWRCSPLYQ